MRFETLKICVFDGDGRVSKGFVQNHIRGLPANARQFHQLVPRLWDLAAKLINYHLAERDHILGFVAPKPDRFDMLLHAFEAERQHFFGRIRDFEQLFRGFVDPDICRLGRKRDGDDKRIRIDEIELGFWVRPVLCQLGIEQGGFFFPEGTRGAFAFWPCHSG